MDFTLTTYRHLLHALQQQGFSFQPFGAFLEKPAPRMVILRHDVDRKPGNALRTAQVEHEMSIAGSYYFRAVPQSFSEPVIRQIAALGHEIGYHYENLATCHGDFEQAITDFEKNLEHLRTIAPVTTICMHGSPLSKWDSRLLWEKYDYRDFGIIGEPYYDIDFSKVLYLTDTGRRWNGERVSVRDKVGRRGEGVTERPGDREIKKLNDIYKFHSTFDIIRAIESKELPDQIMITVHPQRWDGRPFPWIRELVWQNAKNVVKRMYVAGRRHGDTERNGEEGT